MKILIDADACPVTNLVIKLAKERGIEVLLFCDTAHVMEKEGVETFVVSKGMDAVDFVLVNRVKPGDVVVTQDYGLAAMVLSKKGKALNQNGLIFSENNIEGLLMSRHISKKIRDAGGRTKGPKKRTKEDDDSFVRSFLKVLEVE